MIHHRTAFAERCDRCGKRYVYIAAHRARCGPQRERSFHDPRLTPRENQACALIFSGLSRKQAADEMEICLDELRHFLGMARRKGVAVPHAPTGRSDGPAVPIGRLLEIREQLKAAGVMRGVFAVIGERVGMTGNAVKVRIWKHEHKRGQP